MKSWAMPDQAGMNILYPTVAAHRTPNPSKPTQSWLMLAAAVASIAAAPVLHAFSAPLAVAIIAVVAVAISASVPAWTPAIAIFVLLFQNLFVSLFSPLIPDVAALDFIKGYNFLVCAAFWFTTVVLFMLGQRNNSKPVNRLMLQSSLVLGVILIYFAYGLQQNGIVATVYLRNIVLPLFLFQLALLTTSTFEIRITPALVVIAIIFLLCGYIELTFRDFWLYVTNGRVFWGFDEIKATASGAWEREMRITGSVFVDIMDRFRFSFLNTPLLEGWVSTEIYRVLGPNMSAISYAYGVCFFSLFLFSVSQTFLAVLALPLAIFCGVKGALIMTLFVYGGWLSTRLIGAVATLWFALAVLIVYAALGLYLGLQIGDFHVIGFMGGWNGFLQVPLGRGLGTGGNLSDNFFSINWAAAQEAGSVNGAAESAVGVLLYQMGIGAFAVLGMYFAIGMKVWRLFAASGNLTQGFAAFGIFVMLANGIFQEEALFSPPAIGLLLCLAGMVIGNAVRTRNSSPAGAGRLTPAAPLTV